MEAYEPVGGGGGKFHGETLADALAEALGLGDGEGEPEACRRRSASRGGWPPGEAARGAGAATGCWRRSASVRLRRRPSIGLGGLTAAAAAATASASRSARRGVGVSIWAAEKGGKRERRFGRRARCCGAARRAETGARAGIRARWGGDGKKESECAG